MATNDIPFTIADRTFRSRLIVGSGKYPSHTVMAQALEASGADMVTVAVRRVNISDRTRESLLDYIDTSRVFVLPNTAGCYSADEAVRTAMLGRETGDPFDDATPRELYILWCQWKGFRPDHYRRETRKIVAPFAAPLSGPPSETVRRPLGA